MSLLEVITGGDEEDEALRLEVDRVQAEAEKFLAPLLPLLEDHAARIGHDGVKLRLRLFVGQYPMKHEGNPVEAGLMVSLSGTRVWNGGKVYRLTAYAPDNLPWLAAELERAIQEHLDDPEFGHLDDAVHNMSVRLVRYRGSLDHEHCYCCGDRISNSHEEISEAFRLVLENGSSGAWLCPRCFEYWAPLRNLVVD